MSIFFDFDVGPSGRRFRRAVDGDKHDIKTFHTNKLDKLFGEVDIGALIELSALSICMINEEKDVVGFMALCDYPNVPSVDPADWEFWIRNMFQRFYLSRNTLFIHYMSCEDFVIDFFLNEALITVFDNDMYLQQIVLVIPPGCSEDVMNNQAMRKRNVYKYFAKSLDDNENNHYIYTFHRNEFCPKLKMRRAVEEDNDDIVQILDKKCPRLKDLYGSYYVSEIISRHPESSRKIIVAEFLDKAVGVMCLNSDINYEKLVATYELRAFYGLKKATPLEKEQRKRANSLLSIFGVPIMEGKWSPFQRMVKIETENIVDDDSVLTHSEPNIRGTKNTSKVNFGRNTAMHKSLDDINFKHENSDDFSDQIYTESPAHSMAADCSVIELLDGDSFEYDIVNIDKELLVITEAVSCDLNYRSKRTQFSTKPNLSDTHKRRKSRTSISTLNKSESNEDVIYKGEPNAFMIELFGFDEDVHDRHAFDLLQAAFEIMKTYDYCIIRVLCEDKIFPLLQHFCYVPLKPKICSKYALYVAHRSSILGKMRVRPAELSDVPQIAQFLQNLEMQETLWTIENTVLQKTNYTAYVYLSGLSIVGIGILEPPEKIDLIRTKLNLDLYHNHKYHLKGNGIGAGLSTLKMALAYPSFDVHYRYFAREMMRLSGGSSLIWYTAYRNKWVADKANSLASSMIPLQPRKSEIDCTVLPELTKITTLSRKITAFSSWFIGRRITSVPKVDVNTRIVIVGASRTAMAFLDTLLFSDASTYLNFTNVTFISPHGLPYIRQTNKAAEMMFPKYRTTSDRYMKSVPYTYYTNIIHGTMTEIDKRGKNLTLTNGSKYYYDMLFLLLGKQFQHPNYLKELGNSKKRDNTKYIRLDVPRPFELDTEFITEVLPENVFVVNNIHQADKAVKYIKNIICQNDNYRIIVYGASIHAYCCLAALLELKVPAQNIVFVEPFPDDNINKTRVPVFCNVNVDNTLREVIENLKMTVYRSYHFQSWTVDTYNTVTQVEFLSYFQAINLDCTAFFYYGKTGISVQALNAIKNSGLVYDGGILINHEFKTKDPSIYAAGPATRYRRYYAEALRLKYYDSYEVGEKLGIQIRNQLDPLFISKKTLQSSSIRISKETLSDSTLSSSQRSLHLSDNYSNSKVSDTSYGTRLEKIPTFRKPIVTHCMLPGGLQYLEVRSPGKKIPHYFVQTLHFNGYVMETFKGGYFKLHMNNDYIIDGITCLSPESTSLDNFKNLYGLSATVLNNVYLRYTAKKIDDFYTFFRSEWAFYLYHDGVDDLFAMAKELLPKGQRKGATLREALQSVRKTLSNPSYRFDTKMRMRSGFEQSPHFEAITDYVIEWLSDNDILLPMYLQKETQVNLSRDLGTHPAFKKKQRMVNIVKKAF